MARNRKDGLRDADILTAINKEKKHHITLVSFTPARLVLIIAVSVFLIEAMIMIVLPHPPVLSITTTVLLDTSALVLLLSPILYFFLFHPLLQHISERRAVEERLQIITENAADAIVCVNDRDEIYIWNKKAHEIFGYTAEEAEGKLFYSLIIPERYREKAVKGFELFLKTGTGPIIGKVMELAALRKDGTEFPVELSVSATNISGHWHSTAVIRDVTKRRKMQDVLRKSQEKFRNLIESTSDWVWEVDESGIYTYASSKVKDLLGYEPQEIIGKSPFDLMEKEEAKRVAEEFGAIVNARKSFAGLENNNLHKDGRLVVLETSGVPIFDAEGKFRGYRGIDRDVTERKKLAEKVKEQLDYLMRFQTVAVDREFRIKEFMDENDRLKAMIKDMEERLVQKS